MGVAKGRGATAGTTTGLAKVTEAGAPAEEVLGATLSTTTGATGAGATGTAPEITFGVMIVGTNPFSSVNLIQLHLQKLNIVCKFIK